MTNTKQKPRLEVVEPQKLQFGSRWDYAPAPESAKLVKLQSRYSLFINGKWVEPKSGNYFQTINPSNEEVLADVANGNEQDVDRAVQAAQNAYKNVWSKMAPAERAKYIYRLARQLQEKAREMAIIESMDNGKPIKETRDFDVPTAAAHLFYHAGWADKLEYAFPGRTSRPLGVCGLIVPWNFPLLIAIWKIAPALACGNTVVIKPSKATPLSLLHLAKIIEESGLPAGVINVVTGTGKTGDMIVRHPDIRKISFTGSTSVGKGIIQAAAGTGKRLTMELGGKSANIVFEDAPINQAIEGIINGIYYNQGHVCCAGSRLFVQEGIHDQVVRKLKDRLQTLRVGDPLDKNTDVGAINSKDQLETIRELVQSGQDEGCEMFQSSCKLPEKGYWFAPTFFTGVGQSNRIAQEEIFGPVLSILTFRTPEEAVEKANNSAYGLAAAVWTDKGSKIFKISQKLRAGVIWGNTYNKFDPTAPFGGYKESGYGREGGVHGLGAYVELV